jgi:hypothetical protein
MEFHHFEREFLPSSLVGIKISKIVKNKFILTEDGLVFEVDKDNEENWTQISGIENAKDIDYSG